MRRGGAAAVVRTGMGEAKSRAAAARLAAAPAVVVAGMCAGMRGLVPGDVVVASEVRDPDGTVVPCPWAESLAEELRRAGLAVHVGPVATVRKLVRPAERVTLADAGVIAADMESSFLLAGVWAGGGTSPWAVLRVVSDAPGHELLRPGIVRNGMRAYRALKAAAPALAGWPAAAVAAHSVDSAPLPTADGPEGADLGMAERREAGRDTTQDGGA
ncbi:phosphorylase family protein [Yinghuangia soli]|nr:1-hydroxy-2-methyl-2-butenyl 4-diphosphate reductase [Yinghuangia soli]